MLWAWVQVDLLCEGALLGVAAGEVVVAEVDAVDHQDVEAQVCLLVQFFCLSFY